MSTQLPVNHRSGLHKTSSHRLPKNRRTGLVRNRRTGLRHDHVIIIDAYDESSPDSDDEGDSSDSDDRLRSEISRGHLSLEAQSWENMGDKEFNMFMEGLTAQEEEFAESAVFSQYVPDGIKMMAGKRRFEQSAHR